MSYLNLSYILENVSDDPEFIQELLYVFLESLKTDVPALEDAIAAGNHERIRRNAHKVKSGFRSLGVEGMTNYLQELEDMGKNASMIESIQDKFNGFLSDLPKVRAEILMHLD